MGDSLNSSFFFILIKYKYKTNLKILLIIYDIILVTRLCKIIDFISIYHICRKACNNT